MVLVKEVIARIGKVVRNIMGTVDQFDPVPGQFVGNRGEHRLVSTIMAQYTIPQQSSSQIR